MSRDKLSHYDELGAARMVDVSGKQQTTRTAKAHAFVRVKPDVLAKLPDNPKGNPLEVARIAGVMAAKRTSELIPLCHPLGIDGVDVSLTAIDANTIRIEATVRVHSRTGVEMEALMAVTIAGLTIYDMCKAIDRTITLGPARLLEKLGGKSGHFLVT